MLVTSHEFINHYWLYNLPKLESTRRTHGCKSASKAEAWVPGWVSGYRQREASGVGPWVLQQDCPGPQSPSSAHRKRHRVHVYVVYVYIGLSSSRRSVHRR